MSLTDSLLPELVLDSMNEGVYVTDLDRQIAYWGKAAERITGWSRRDVIGKHCHDSVLCHIDKDGHPLCGEEYCPLHRSMQTGQASKVPIIVFAQRKDGHRVPLQVTVAPLRDAGGQIVGGVETFHDLSHEFGDINRACKIQQLSLQLDLPADPRIRFATRYVPQDIVGGDYHAIARLDADCYGFLLADVTGHGVPAALYTMYLSSLWTAHQQLLREPVRFATTISDGLHLLIQEQEPFAAAICGVFDLKAGQLRLVGAGNPPPLVFRKDGSHEQPEAFGLPFGVMEGAPYEEVVVGLGSGDTVLLFTDGAIEITSQTGECQGLDEFVGTLRKLGYPESRPDFVAIETEMLANSDRIRFDDDVTFVEARIA